MTDASSAPGRLTEDWYARLFAEAPIPLLVVDRDLVLVEANAAYRRSVGWSDSDAAAALGRPVFDVFPNNPGRVTIGGEEQVTSLRAIMQRVVQTGAEQVVTGFRYDIPVPGTDRFEVRHWNFTEVPLLDDAGEVRYFLHFNQDVSDLVQRLEEGDAAAAARDDLRQRVERAQADLLLRARQLQELNERLQEVGEHDRAVASALQQALLTDLPDPRGLRLVARYRTAAGDQVGGDWYDALVLASGTTVAVIGDVVGHDITAAGLMGQLRSMVRTFAWSHEGRPGELLELTDRAMHDLRVDTFATAVVAALDATADGWRLRWSNAGHPPPLLLTPDGTVDVLDSGDRADVLLGVLREVPRREFSRDVAPGSTLLLYTDGLVERSDLEVEAGVEAVRATLARHRDLGPDELLAAVLAETIGERPTDDVAVLLVRCDEPPRG